ncbi:DUF4262 domain-containing protein [Paraburkholderia sp. MM6662-R1]|uniref:DUF4262 domain-containing protein n=1 Tax=Paraburkholderia sp. MM6662-R1 TaxID=2991066 RepID=UPI003D1A9679
MDSNDYLLKIDRLIASHGHAVQGVFDPDGKKAAYGYTIGNVLQGLPELLVSGLPPDIMMPILNDTVALMRAGTLKVTDHARTSDIAQGYDTAFRLVDLSRVDDEINLLKVWCRLHEIELPPVYQLVWPDAQNRFPWEPGFTEKMRAMQPVLYSTVH